MKKKNPIILLFIMTSINVFCEVSPMEGDEYFLVNDSNVNVRSAPDIKADIITKLIFGQKVWGIFDKDLKDDINTVENYWYKIRLDNDGKFGYVWGEYISWILCSGTIGDKKFTIINNKIKLGRYLNSEFLLSDINIFINNKISKIKFNNSKRKQIQYLQLFKTIDNKNILMSVWFFSDAEVFSQNYELFQFNIENYIAEHYAYNGIEE